MPDPRHQLGRRAEDAVAAWLAGRGWTVLEHRWRRAGIGELDLVCVDPEGRLVGVEVKLRSSERVGSAPESVRPARLARLRRALASYAGGTALPSTGLRLDLVCLTPAGDGAWRLTHLRGIGGW